jgi:Family of unknown function (DUF6114)
LGATEILASERAPLPIIIHIGIQGLAGYLIPIVLGLCGFLLWFHPIQHTFYSVLAVLLALGSWATSNLGGFFVGMLLGLIGGSLAFAWTRSGDPEPPRPVPRERPKMEPSEGIDLILGDPYSDTSEDLYSGASENPYSDASEDLYSGASEDSYSDTSEDPYSGASEERPTSAGQHEQRGGSRVHYPNGEGGREPRREADGDEPGGASRYRSVILALPVMLSVIVALPRHGCLAIRGGR